MTEVTLDPAVFGEMRDLMGEALADFIHTYLDNSPRLINKIETGLAQQDAESIYHAAHQLKGGSGSIGALKLAAISLDIEQLGKAGTTEGVAPHLSNLKSEFEQVATALKAQL